MKYGDCKTKTYYNDEHIISSEGIPQRQQFYQEFVILAVTHGGPKRLAANGEKECERRFNLEYLQHSCDTNMLLIISSLHGYVAALNCYCESP